VNVGIIRLDDSSAISFLCNNYLSWVLSFSVYTQQIWTSKVSRSMCSLRPVVCPYWRLYPPCVRGVPVVRSFAGVSFDTRRHNIHCVRRAVHILRRFYSESIAFRSIDCTTTTPTQCPCSRWQPYYGPSPLLMLLFVTALSALGHFDVLSSFERCSQQQPFLPLDIYMSFPLLNVAPCQVML
jgi:hypothetical protein